MKSRLSVCLLVGLAAMPTSAGRASDLQPSPASDTQIVNLFRHNAEARIVIVTGVRSPGIIHLGTDEKQELSEVILKFGGFTGFHSPFVQVFRLKNDRIVVFSVHLSKILNGTEPEVILVPGDFVEVR